jgi:hypothetical protein
MDTKEILKSMKNKSVFNLETSKNYDTTSNLLNGC